MALIAIALLIGVLLRVLYVQDMEYKEDEEYNFTQSQLIGNSQPWPWYGIPSGVYLVNPGMSIWVFAGLAKLFKIHEPTSLAHAVQLFALFGMSLIIPFVIRFISSEKERETWLWAFLLAMVNPFLILYQRKLWPEPFLPFFTLLTLMGWWKRKDRGGAFIWGLIGSWLGQIHMSGFFFSAAIFLWTVLFDRNRSQNSPAFLNHTKWKFWFLGSVLGSLPLIPWFLYVIQHPVGGAISTGWGEAIQLKFWTFWFTDPLGLHLGNPLGILRGNSHWDQISDFVRYPILFGHATYLTGIAHLAAAVCAIWILGRGASSLWRNRRFWKEIAIGKESETAFLQNATFWACGILLTLTGVMIRRYYMAVTFPLEFICLIRMAKPHTRVGRVLLTVLWISECTISANFVGYIHVNEGSISGDYGKAFHLINSKVD